MSRSVTVDGFGKTRIKKGKKKWRGVVSYYTVVPGADGAPVKEWHEATRTLEVPCRAADNSGRRAAERALSAWVESLDGGREDLLPTLNEYVAESVEFKIAAGQVATSTANSYRRAIAHIAGGRLQGVDVPPLGELRIDELTQRDVQQWVNALVPVYSPPTIKYDLLVVRSVTLDRAVNDGLIPKNPARGVKTPPRRRPEPNYLLPEDRARVLALIDEQRYPLRRQYIAIKTALYTGMREGELCGLRWSGVDLERRVIKVKDVIARDGNGFAVRSWPKTSSSRREIPIPDAVLDDLARLRRWREARCRAAGIELTRQHFVFGRTDGRFLNPPMLYRNWKRIRERLGIVGSEGRPVVFHDLRHTFATVLYQNGVDIKTISGLLGHASAAMTLDIYASADPKAKRAAMDRIGSMM